MGSVLLHTVTASFLRCNCESRRWMVLATAPPYTRFLNENIDFAVISPGTPRGDIWMQEIPCVLADDLVEYVCKPRYALDKHALYDTNSWAERSFNKPSLVLFWA